MVAGVAATVILGGVGGAAAVAVAGDQGGSGTGRPPGGFGQPMQQRGGIPQGSSPQGSFPQGSFPQGRGNMTPPGAQDGLGTPGAAPPGLDGSGSGVEDTMPGAPRQRQQRHQSGKHV